MQIDVDFDVFQALTLRRRNEEDSCGDVVRRLLMIADSVPATADVGDQLRNTPLNILMKLKVGAEVSGPGAWIGNVFFPDGTQFRATYKGRSYRAEIKLGEWVDENGVRRQSPSEAAGAISATKVNGWRFWYAKRPADDEWVRLDELRK